MQKELAVFVMGVLTFYKQDTSDFAVDVWLDALSGYDINDIKQAFKTFTRTNENYRAHPYPNDIIKLIDGSSSDKASLAWHKVDRAVRTVGGYESVVFDDPIIHVVIEEIGGWGFINNQDEESFKFTANHFKTAYKGYALREELPPYQTHLIGISEQSNREFGREIAPPKYIGDVEKARLVWRGGSEEQRIGLTSISDIKLLGE